MTPDGWKRIDRYCIERGRCTIARVTVRDVLTYELWPGQHIFTELEKAIAKANELEGE